VREAAAVTAAAAGRPVTPAQLLVRWLRHSGVVAIPRSSKAARIAENRDCPRPPGAVKRH
jgi:diketogulonate reductase-like aldo/keto reductase